MYSYNIIIMYAYYCQILSLCTLKHYNYVRILLSYIKFMYSYNIIIMYAYYCHKLSSCTLITL